MTLLCATHFSDAARQAATVSAGLARKLDEPLILVHVLPVDMARAFGQALRDKAMSTLADEARRLEQAGARVSHQLLTGEPAEELARFAREKGVKWVVTAEPTRASRFLGLGGTVDRLATVLPIPLWVVRGADSLEAWIQGTRPLRVMLGVDRSLPFEAARDWLRGLRRHGPVEVVAGRIYWPFEEYQRMGLAQPLTIQDVTPELRHALEQEVSAQVSSLAAPGQPVRLRLEARVGRIADHLVALAAEEQVDLLVVGSRQRRALGKLASVSHHALRLAKMSVVSVPRAAATRGEEVPIPALRSVLVATDFSEAANRAIPYAFSLLPTGGTVHVVTVEKNRRHHVEQERDLRQELHQLLPRDADAQGREVHVEVLSGEDVATVILKAAERLGVDVLCLGTHGHSGMKKTVMGAVAKEVVARADRPVMVVRPPEG
ncbi:universal stress protein [Melittangium boletus]|uniref:Universal stress protein n=1 Tax=Melittangium boletus DSM 14713 TaxID=1294270 RepID=A0A250I6B8_9BACT|nr:universal stress protein [Melittangium boletus]ATB27399.1 universal stress protein [Melittangium boletus DSM 14713]